MNYIDSHVHIGQDRGGIAADLDDIDQMMADSQVEKAVVFCLNEVEGIAHGNERIKDIVRQRDDLAGLFRIDPAQHSPDDLRGIDWAAGFKMHPRSQDFSMQQVYAHLETIADEDKPVLIHTGGWGHKDRGHPREIIEAARVHRDTTVIAAHNTKGYYFQASDDDIDDIKQCDNLCIETSLHCTPLGIETLVNDLGSERVLFGSDYPYGHPVPMENNVELADIDDDQAADVARENAKRLFF
ncbi:MAG: amidohydrolase family protein [Candidatus Nanohaloarchaea archaeon]|nr:amidohydrolase family protein [Candidatus Nanohaloarchaea archaeon]